MKRLIVSVLSIVTVFTLFCRPASAVYSDSVQVWGGFGRADNVYSCAITDRKVIALTFDDGPHPKYTDEILDILSEYNVKATFFVIGQNAKAYPDKLKRVVSEGHEVGNHTYTHMTSNHAERSKLSDELKMTDKIITDIVGVKPVLFRPPTGYCNLITVQSAADMKYKIILWTVDTRDWAHTAEKTITGTVMSQIKNGSIILFHDYISGNSPTPGALRKIIPALLGDGYSFVTVSELIACEHNG